MRVRSVSRKFHRTWRRTWPWRPRRRAPSSQRHHRPPPPPPPLSMCSWRLDRGATGQLSDIWLGLWESASGDAAQSASMLIVGKNSDLQEKRTLGSPVWLAMHTKTTTATPRPPLRCPPYEDQRPAMWSRASSVNSHQGSGGSRGKRREARAPINPSSKQLDLDKTKILNPDLRRWRPFLRRRRLGSPRAQTRTNTIPGSPRPSRSLAACSWGEMLQENPLSTQPSRFTSCLVPPRLSVLDPALPPAVQSDLAP